MDMANADMLSEHYYSSPSHTDLSAESSPHRAAMASLSPTEQYTNKSASGYGSGQSDHDASKSPLSMSLGFLKNLTEKKTTRGRHLCRKPPIAKINPCV